MKRLFLKFLNRLAITMGLLVVAIGVLIAWPAYDSGRRLEARLDAVRAVGGPLSLADLAGRTIPAEDDADVALEDVAAEVEVVGKGLEAIFPDAARQAGPLGDDQWKLKDLFRDHPDVVPRLMEAADRPDYVHPYDVSVPTEEFLQEVTDVARSHGAASRVILAWADLLAAQGKRNEAVTAVVAGLKLSAHWARDPMILGYPLAIATTRRALAAAARVLRSGPVSEESRRALDAELARRDGLGDYRRALRTERVFALVMNRGLARHMWVGGDFYLSKFMDYYDERLKRSETPYHKLADLAPPIATQAYRYPREVPTDLAGSNIIATREGAETQRAAVRSLRAFSALQALPADVPPPAADRTILGIPVEATIDPFTERPLIVRKLPGGWLVYSVGPDLVDDGGTFDNDRDIGFGPVSKENPPAACPDGRATGADLWESP